VVIGRWGCKNRMTTQDGRITKLLSGAKHDKLCYYFAFVFVSPKSCNCIISFSLFSFIALTQPVKWYVLDVENVCVEPVNVSPDVPTLPLNTPANTVTVTTSPVATITTNCVEVSNHNNELCGGK